MDTYHHQRGDHSGLLFYIVKENNMLIQTLFGSEEMKILNPRASVSKPLKQYMEFCPLREEYQTVALHQTLSSTVS
jgi:hypothetical protein